LFSDCIFFGFKNAVKNNIMSEEVVKFVVQWKSETNKFILCTASFSTEEYLQEYIKHRNITPIEIWRERSTLVDNKVVSVVKENYEGRN
jgi:hypothetical protein